MMEEELKQLKSTLKSLVVSSPTTMDVRTLLRDYRNMVGGPLPLTKYGYRDPVQFLRERCGDCFLLQGMPSNPILTLIVSENLKHIDQFVQKQKVSAKHKGKRRSVPESIIKPPAINDNLICRTFNKKSRAVSTNYSNLNQSTAPLHKNNNTLTNNIALTKNKTEGKTEFKNDIPTKCNENILVFRETNDTKPNKIETEMEKSHHDIAIKTGEMENHNYPTAGSNTSADNKEYSEFNDENCPGNALSKFFKKRLPQYVSSENFPLSEVDIASKEDTDSGKQSSSSQSSSTKQARLDELKGEIFALIQDSEDGVWCTDILRLYREKYGRDLKFNRFGHTSVISLVYSLEERVAVTRPEPHGDWLLQEASRSMGGGVPRAGGARRGGGARVPRPPRDPPRDPDDALPGVDFEPDVFPEDCMHYMDAIPPPPLADIAQGDMLEVIVGEVYSPSHFWMLRVGAQYNLAMEDIMDEMTEYYSRGEGAARVLARGAIRVGQYCTSEYERDWHRSLIVHIIDSDTVKVRHVDYGTVDTVRAEGLKPLVRRWAALPAQAVRARLAGCRPGAGGLRWPRAACAAFLQCVRQRRLYANVVHVAREEDIVETFLVDTTGAEDVCITRELIRMDHADARRDSALRSGDAYLYPRFDALESGATPNYAEIHRYLRDGIALEYVEAYRRHVPVALPPSPPPPPPPLSPPAPPSQLVNGPPPCPAELTNLVPSPPAHLDPASPAPSKPSWPMRPQIEFVPGSTLPWPNHRPAPAPPSQGPASPALAQHSDSKPTSPYATQVPYYASISENSTPKQFNLGPASETPSPQFNGPAPTSARARCHHGSDLTATLGQCNLGPVPNSTLAQYNPGRSPNSAQNQYSPGANFNSIQTLYNPGQIPTSTHAQYNLGSVPNLKSSPFKSGPVLRTTEVQHHPGQVQSSPPVQNSPGVARLTHGPASGSTPAQLDPSPALVPTSTQFSSSAPSAPRPTPAQHNPGPAPSSTASEFNPSPRAGAQGEGGGGGGVGGAGTVQVRLSEAEWAVLRHLRAADPGAAHMYVLASAWRAMLPPPPGF